MNKNLLSKITNYLNNHKIKSRHHKIFLGLAMIVVFATVYLLMMPAITMGETLICTEEEHTHTDECYKQELICDETSDNLNDESCYKKILSCEKEEHTHTNNCYVTDTQLESINNLISIIDNLPGYEEFNNKITELESVSTEKVDNYTEDIISKVQNAYNIYYKMSELEKTQITNIDKLIEYVDNDLVTEPIAIDDTENNTSSVALFSLTQNNVKLPTITTSANTYDIIKVNLYNYGISINDPYNANQKYPGFQQDGGTHNLTSSSTEIKTWNYNFGNNITSEIADIKSGVTKNKTDINQVITNDNGSMIPLTGKMQATLGTDGYPAMINGESLGYLFGAPFNSSNDSTVESLNGTTYATKQNTDNINGLFKQDEDTGAYYYDSRVNHAQYSNNTFTLYNEKITSNYIMYPFGNFLPFNDITNDTTYVNRLDSSGNYVYGIDRTRLQEIAESAKDKSSSTTDVYYKLYTSLTNFVRLMDIKLGNTSWNALDTVNDYFRKSKIIEETASVDPSILLDLYSIDYDIATDFFFGLDMEMNFIQPKDGLTGKDGKQQMIFDFNGDDDVWVYIDNILFLDLTGIHRHVGGKIDFVNGIVYYYDLNKSTGEISETAYLSKTFSTILEEAGYTQEQIANALVQTGTNENGNPIYGTFVNYSMHNFKFYYMERGAGSGVMKMNFNMPLLKENSISVTKELSVDDDTIEKVGNPDFSFQILAANTDETKTNNLFIGANVPYDIYDEFGNKVYNLNENKERYTITDEEGNSIEVSGITDEYGVFTIKAGQTAVFSGIEEDDGKYYVRELLDKSWVEQYKNVTIDGSSITSIEDLTDTDSDDIEINGEKFEGVESPIKDISNGNTAFKFNNNIETNKYGSIGITKNLTGYQENQDNIVNQEFAFTVTLDGTSLPAGTEYTVIDSEGNSTTKTIASEGENAGKIVINATETAIIKNILAGSIYKITEDVTNNGYTVTYIQNGTSSTTSAEGIVLPNTNTETEEEQKPTVSVDVNNQTRGGILEIPITKTIINPNTNSYTYTFSIVEVTDETGNTEKYPSGTNTNQLNSIQTLEQQVKATIPNGSITVNSSNTNDKLFTLTYLRPSYQIGTTKHYYKIVEVNTGDEFTEYDNTYFVIEVTVTNGEGDIFTAEITNIYKYSENEPETVDNVEFKNTLLSDLTISKIVENPESTSGEFTFRITLENEDGTPLTGTYNYKKIDENNQTSSGEFSFSEINQNETLEIKTNDIKLKHNELITIEKLPAGIKYTIEELTTEGYVVKYKIDNGTTTLGVIANNNLNKGDNQINFINITGYELPATGSSGMLILLIIGSLLLIGPVIYIGYSFYRFRKNIA